MEDNVNNTFRNKKYPLPSLNALSTFAGNRRHKGKSQVWVYQEFLSIFLYKHWKVENKDLFLVLLFFLNLLFIAK